MFNEEELEEGDDDSEVTHHVCGSIEGLRDHVLEMFGGFIAHISGEQPAENQLEHQRQFLEVWEVENIVKELSDVRSDGVYGIGANSFEEYREKMLQLFRTLASRIVSNVMHAGVKQGLLDAEYDVEQDRFEFSITEKGKELVGTLAAGQDAENDGTNDSHPDV
jgi:hypothetical protein